MPTQKPWKFLFLAVLVVLTRGSHFGSLTHLPDASWAAFFVAGAISSSLLPFVALTAGATVLDAWAVAYGVGAVCITPAYVALLPAYGALFFAGRWAARGGGETFARARRVLASATLAVLVAYVATSGAYYGVVVRGHGVALGEFVRGSATHVPAYLATTLGYVALLLPSLSLVEKRLMARSHG